jgi:hypothetical protein
METSRLHTSLVGTLKRKLGRQNFKLALVDRVQRTLHCQVLNPQQNCSTTRSKLAYKRTLDAEQTSFSVKRGLDYSASRQPQGT